MHSASPTNTHVHTHTCTLSGALAKTEGKIGNTMSSSLTLPETYLETREKDSVTWMCTRGQGAQFALKDHSQEPTPQTGAVSSPATAVCRAGTRPLKLQALKQLDEKSTSPSLGKITGLPTCESQRVDTRSVSWPAMCSVSAAFTVMRPPAPSPA